MKFIKKTLFILFLIFGYAIKEGVLLFYQYYNVFKIKAYKCPYCDNCKFMPEGQTTLFGHSSDGHHKYNYYSEEIFIEFFDKHSKIMKFQFHINLIDGKDWSLYYFGNQSGNYSKKYEIPISHLKSKKDFDKKMQSILLLE